MKLLDLLGLIGSNLARRKGRVALTTIGVIFAGFFALGGALLSARGDYSIDLAHFLFGNLLRCV